MIDCVITTGGTGVTGRDVTPEAISQVADKMIPGFGELFRWLSFQSIGTSTVQSRACACVASGTYIFALPGSTGAVQDGWEGIAQKRGVLGKSGTVGVGLGGRRRAKQKKTK